MASRRAIDKLSALRALMKEHNIHALVVPTSDPHQSEYVSQHHARREFISGFTGSAGTAVITMSEARLWTDGRYFLQAGKQLDAAAGWSLMKDRLPETPPVEKWLSTQLARGNAVGIDPSVFPLSHALRMQTMLRTAGMTLTTLPAPNLVDQVWGPEQPPIPCTPVTIHELVYAGSPLKEKLAVLRKAMALHKAEALVVAACDEVCWVFNIRGADVECNPVTLAYAVVTQEAATLFIDGAKLTPAVSSALAAEGVSILPYDDVYSHVSELPGLVWLDPSSCNYALYQAATARCAAGADQVEARVLQKMSPIQLLKSVKNETEIAGMRACHVRDAVALTTFLAWVEIAVTQGVDARTGAPLAAPLTEYTAGAVLDGMRALQKDFVSLSFPTIAGMGANGAVIHYHAEEGTAAQLTTEGLFLLDSGGQYKDGTTDVTRTVHFGTPTAAEKRAFTRVLQGHIGLSSARFPSGVSGIALDTLARSHLWAAGMDYRHGTGHGVGSFLNVHEGPQGAAVAARSTYDGGLVANMTLTDEPGYYVDGAFGIRIENVLVAQESPSECGFGDKPWLNFEVLTVVPISPKLVDTGLLSQSQRDWLEAYNARVRVVLEPLLADNAWALAYLRRETAAE